MITVCGGRKRFIRNIAYDMKVVDLFCGAGGMSLGFKRAGFELVCAVDNWPAALECYKLNFKRHPVKQLDISNWEAVAMELKESKPDIVIGGPPCQDFSDAGLRVEGKRAKLTSCFAHIVATLQPKYFVMENVPRALKSKAYAEAEGIFKNAGYGLTKVILDASLCGVPQARSRFFCIGAKGAPDGFLSDALLFDVGIVPMSVRDYLGDEIDVKYYYRHPRSYARRAIFSIDEPSATIRGCNRPMPETYVRHPADAADPVRHRLRCLTYQERARIQTFPANYKWTGSECNVNQIIGNAVPVNLALFVARHLKEFIESNCVVKVVPQTFSMWLSNSKQLSKAAAGDVISHYRRAAKIGECGSQKEVSLEALQKCSGFKRSGQDARRQMVHACDLRQEYLLYVQNFKKGNQNEGE
mgnify:CR=1 FL=1